MHFDAHERRIERELRAGQDGRERHGPRARVSYFLRAFLERRDALLEFFEPLAAAPQDARPGCRIPGA